MGYFPPRSAKTSIPCPECGEKLVIARSCSEVFMRCGKCGREYPLKDFIASSDKAMDEFLENVYIDRI